MGDFLQKIRETNLIEKGDRIVAGVSGGADSVCLLMVLSALRKEYGLYVCAVHVNHGIRGDQAKEDEEFVWQLCKTLDTDCFIRTYDVPGIAQNLGLGEEEAGRKVRYEAFEEVATQQSCNKIAVAHNREDNAETILYHVFRGTGITGLVGMEARNGKIVRPLLQISRREIEGFLKERGQAYRTDATNLSTKYTRNKLRLELIPYVEREINPRMTKHIVSMGEQLLEIKDFLELSGQKACRECVVKKMDEQGGVLIQKEPFLRYHPAVQKEVIREVINEMAGHLKDITANHVEGVLALMDRQVSKYICLPYQIRVKRCYEGILFQKEQTKNKSRQEKEGQQGLILRQICISVEEIVKNKRNFLSESEKSYTKWIDYDKIKDTLVLRHRQPGDYIVINRKGGRKKLKDYFIDQKIPSEQRDSIWLVADGKEVVWIIGHRLSERYKITDDTGSVLQMEVIWETGGESV